MSKEIGFLTTLVIYSVFTLGFALLGVLILQTLGSLLGHIRQRSLSCIMSKEIGFLTTLVIYSVFTLGFALLGVLILQTLGSL